MKHLFFLCLMGLAVAHAEESEDFRYRVEVLAEGMPQPMTMQMAPDGRIFFHEIGGKLRLLDPATKEIKEVGELEVTTGSEKGFLGMALDPAFAGNGWIYLLHSPRDYKGHVISRFTVRNDTLDVESRHHLLRWNVEPAEGHHGGALRFGPDGNLYASTGDNANPFASDGYTPIDQRDGRSPWDAQRSAANTNDLRGKILRIRPAPDGGYTIPEGNLFPPGMEGTRPEIYAMGFRNPWRFQIDPKNGSLYVGDVGPDAGNDSDERGPVGFDTIQQIRKPLNAGWPYVRGGEAYRSYDFETSASGEAFDPLKPVNNSPNNTGLRELPPVTPPIIWYPYRASEEFPGLGTGGRTACGGPVFHYEEKFAKTDGFPEKFHDCVLIYDWQRPSIHWMRLDDNGDLAGLEAFTGAVNIALGSQDNSGRTQIRRPIDMFFGPDGCLYLMDYGETWGVNRDSSILKISYQRGNLAPIAQAAGEITEGREPLTIRLSADGSIDPEGKPLSYEWRIQPGDRVVAETETTRVTLEEIGNYTAELLVTDVEGVTSVATIPISVGNSVPVVRFTAPEEGDFFSPGETISYQVEIEDLEDGNSTDGPKAPTMGHATMVSASWTAGEGAAAKPEVGFTLMQQSGCFNCHAVGQPLVGPPLLDIAEKYRGVDGAIELSVDRVLKGSSGVWGPVGMLPHPQHSKDELHMMVSWIYGLKKGKAGPGLARGLTGTVQAPEDSKIQKGTLEVSFTDFGRAPAAPLTGKATVTLRQRFVEAETADRIAGKSSRIITYETASGGQGIGGIENGHHLIFKNVSLASVGSITARISSDHADAKIEFRVGSPDGELLGSMESVATGAREDWAEVTTDLATPSVKRGDIYVVFVQTGNAKRLLNIDWLRFDP